MYSRPCPAEPVFDARIEKVCPDPESCANAGRPTAFERP
jgi:hypothetical protein